MELGPVKFPSDLDRKVRLYRRALGLVDEDPLTIEQALFIAEAEGIEFAAQIAESAEDPSQMVWKMRQAKDDLLRKAKAMQVFGKEKQ